MNIMSLEKFKFFIEKIVHYGFLFVFENFHEQIAIITNIS
jgi:hypothetical protein